ADLAGHQPGVLFAELERLRGVLCVMPPETLQWRERAVPLAEALDTAALLGDADQLRSRRGFPYRLRQLAALCLRGEISGEQDHAGAGVVLQPVALLRGEFGAGDADHEHRGLPGVDARKRTGIVAQMVRGCCGRRVPASGAARPPSTGRTAGSPARGCSSAARP